MIMSNTQSQHCPNCESLAAENERLRDEVVELWHQAPSEERSLQECLGMDIDQYVAWANPKQETKP
jgi:DNA-binding ferritin-like protein (Dps family)